MAQEKKVLIVDDEVDMVRQMHRGAASTVSHFIQCPNPDMMIPMGMIKKGEDPRNNFARVNRLPLTGKKPE